MFVHSCSLTDLLCTTFAYKESARWLSHRFFFKLCGIKVSLCSNKMTNPYDPLFRNTRENHFNTREDICCVSYSLFCAVFYKVWCGRAVIGFVFLVVTSVVRISLLDFFFFCKFRPSCFQVSFLFSSFSFCLSYIVNNFC